MELELSHPCHVLLLQPPPQFVYYYRSYSSHLSVVSDLCLMVSVAQVLDLVHPSLFCLVANLSRVTDTPFAFHEWQDKMGLGEVR